MKCLELTKRINRARRDGEDTSVLEKELAQAEAERERRVFEKRVQKQVEEAVRHNRFTAKQLDEAAVKAREERLREILVEAIKHGYALGWVINEHQRRYGRLPGKNVWKRVVAEYREKVVNAQVEKAAMRVRVWQS